MEISDQDKAMLNNVHTVFYKARLIDSPDLAVLGVQFTQFMQRLMPPPKKEPMMKNADEKKK